MILLAETAQTVASQYAECADIAKIVRDITVAIVSVIGIVIAAKGLKTWRRQLRGNTEYDLARRLLRAVFRVRDGIRSVRNPFMSSGEISQAVEDQYPDDPERQKDHADSIAAVYSARWQRLGDALSELNLESIESEVLWDNEIGDRLKPLQSAVNELHAAIRQHLRQNGKHPSRLPNKRLEEIDRTIYEISDDPEKDEFTRRVQSAVDKVQEFLKPKLKL